MFTFVGYSFNGIEHFGDCKIFIHEKFHPRVVGILNHAKTAVVPTKRIQNVFSFLHIPAVRDILYMLQTRDRLRKKNVFCTENYVDSTNSARVAAPTYPTSNGSTKAFKKSFILWKFIVPTDQLPSMINKTSVTAVLQAENKAYS